MATPKNTQADFLNRLSYNPDTGELRWLIGQYKGQIAGTPRRDGRIGVKFHQKSYLAHRVIWFMQTGEWPRQLDHIDGNPANNRWSNLRLASQSQNCMNKGITQANTSGYKGVYWFRPQRKWVAKLKVNGQTTFLGYFDAPEHAYAAYCRAAVELHGEFARLA